jgi:predicted Zn-dependent protease
MQQQLSQFFADPKMRIIWGIAGVVAVLTALAYRFGAKPPEDRTPEIRQIVQDATGIGRPTARVVVWPFLVWISSLVCFSAGMILNAHSILHRQGQSMLGWLLIAIFLVTGILPGNVKIRGARWVAEKLNRADYDEAIARAGKLLRWFPETARFHYIQGRTLRYAGRLAEAEQAFRSSIGKGQVRAEPEQAFRLECLGEVLLELGRFKEATSAFEAATKIYPPYAGSYSGLAEAWLRQGREAQRALLLVDKALELRQNDVRTRHHDRHELAYMHANRAQALALLGRKEDALSAIETASRVGDPEFIPGLAATFWRCGVALRMLHQVDGANEKFRKAAEMDPRGLYGKLAASEMHEQIESRR